MLRFQDVRQVPVSSLMVSRQQARTRDVSKDLDELVDNIRVQGQLEPIIVAPLEGAEERYEIIAGQRRWLAIQQLGHKTILAAILDGQVDEATARVLSVSENLVRHDLSSKDLIDACTELYRKYGSSRAVAEELGLPYNRVRSYVKYDRLRPQLKDLVQLGQIDVRTAIRIEDHYGDKTADARELEAMVKTVAGMTNAQQTDYFKRVKPRVAAATNGHSTAASTDPMPPGAVQQILVTLRKEDHTRLQQWAAKKGLGQGRAAAEILHAFLQSVEVRAEHNGSST